MAPDDVAGARLAVVQVTKVAQGGGAERIASSLHQGLLRRGHRSWLATARNAGDDPTVLAIPAAGPSRSVPARALRRAERVLAPKGSTRPGAATIRRGLRLAARPAHSIADWLGREDFDFPGTARIPDLPPEPPDLVHCHNLHGRYFDLRQLAPMSARLPVVLTLHDEWTFTGHCGYGIACERWRVGCGSCPDLTLYPAIRRDATRANLRAKRDIYARSRLYVSTPSQWLMDRARASVIAGGAVEGAAGWRMIPNGVDTAIFRPGGRIEARRRLGLPTEPFILLFAANHGNRNPYKDFPTVSEAAARAAAAVAAAAGAAGTSVRPVLCLALGDEGPSRSFANGELQFVQYRSDIGEVAAYFRAADLYLHAAKAENLPTTILEALACGVPVVATAVGGIPEEVRSLEGAPGAWAGEASSRGVATGVLVAPGDAAGMGSAAAALLGDDGLRAELSANAAADAARRFDLDVQLDATIGWYREILAEWRDRARAAGR